MTTAGEYISQISFKMLIPYCFFVNTAPYLILQKQQKGSLVGMLGPIIILVTSIAAWSVVKIRPTQATHAVCFAVVQVAASLVIAGGSYISGFMFPQAFVINTIVLTAYAIYCLVVKKIDYPASCMFTEIDETQKMNESSDIYGKMANEIVRHHVSDLGEENIFEEYYSNMGVVLE